MVSDGYLVVGGGDANDITALPQTMPDPARPNNVLAPLWSDLDGGAGSISGQGFRIGELTDGTNSWIVVQYNVHVYGQASKLENFQVWIGVNGTEDISFAYDTVTDPGLPFNVGAENADGTGGSNFTGLPSPTQDLVMQSTPGAPGGAASFAVTLRPNRTLPHQAPSVVESDMTNNLSRDTAVTKSTVQVLP